MPRSDSTSRVCYRSRRRAPRGHRVRTHAYLRVPPDTVHREDDGRATIVRAVASLLHGTGARPRVVPGRPAKASA
jgi:hypothetical protein